MRGGFSELSNHDLYTLIDTCLLAAPLKYDMPLPALLNPSLKYPRSIMHFNYRMGDPPTGLQAPHLPSRPSPRRRPA